MRLRLQRHRRSCGLACVAMIANKAYNTVIQDFEDLGDEPINWYYAEKTKGWSLNYLTSTYDLHYMLAHYGIKSNKRRVKYKGKLPDVSILTVNMRKETIGGKTNYHWHWVVCEKVGKDKFRVLDPWTGERTLESVLPIDSYVRIHT